jgi:lipopolysaccharide transport system permease protein
LLVQFVFTLGLTLLLSALTVHFRDIQSILGHVVHLWFFATPVLYFYGHVEGWLRWLLRFNPMSHVIVSYQEMLFLGSFEHVEGLVATGLVAVLVFAAGAFLFDRLRDTLAEQV